MTSSITQCPGCYTRFRVTTEQLAAHGGIVRCGLCSAIFNATEHLQEDEPNPQLNLPIVHENTPEAKIEVVTEPDSPVETVATPTVTGTDELETLFQQIDSSEKPIQTEHRNSEPGQRKWLWMAGSALLMLAVLAQVFYFYRVDIAAQLPGLKPALTSYCDLLKCSLPLPSKVELMSIESSDLEADPLQPTLVNLIALLHNRADYTQAYPNLELSLTDTQDKVLARRDFTPSEYLKESDDPKKGLASNRELSIQLHLDTANLKPVGYKLFLYYSR